MASHAGAVVRQEQDPSHYLQRDHRARRQGRLRASRQDRPQEGRRPAGAARARPPRRVQPLAALVGQGSARPLRGTRAVGRRAPDRRPRARDRSVRAARILVAPRAPGCEASAGVHGDAARDRRRACRGAARRQGRDAARRSDHACRHGGSRQCSLDRAQRQSWRASSQPRATLHHVHAAARGGAQARPQRQDHHAHRPAALRGRGPSRRGPGRAHHLYANRLGEHRRAGPARAAGRRQAPVRRGVRAGAAAAVQEEAARGPGSTRGRQAHLGPAGARRRGGAPRARPGPPVPVDLAAHRGLADGRGPFRPGQRGHLGKR